MHIMIMQDFFCDELESSLKEFEESCNSFVQYLNLYLIYQQREITAIVRRVKKVLGIWACTVELFKSLNYQISIFRVGGAPRDFLQILTQRCFVIAFYHVKRVKTVSYEKINHETELIKLTVKLWEKR